MQACLCLFLEDFVNDITPRESDLFEFADATAWISSRLLSFRSHDISGDSDRSSSISMSIDEDFNGTEVVNLSAVVEDNEVDDIGRHLAEGRQIFTAVRRGGSTARGTAILPINDIDLLVEMDFYTDGMFITLFYVLEALTLGSSSVVRLETQVGADAESLLYAISLADESHPEPYRHFIFRWQRHSFGICFGNEWDDSKTNFDIVPVFRQEDKLYLTSRFSHTIEANQEDLPSSNPALIDAIRVLKKWNSLNKRPDGSAPFKSFELEGTIASFWSFPLIHDTACPAKRIVVLFQVLHSIIGKLYRTPDDSEAIFGRGNGLWTTVEVRQLMGRSKVLLETAYFKTENVDVAINIWSHVFRGAPISPDISVEHENSSEDYFVESFVEDDDGNSALHTALLQGYPLSKVKELIGQAELANEINALNCVNRTAIFIAAQFGRSDVVQLLLSAGADPLIPDVSDVLKKAVESRSEECVQILLNHRESMERLSPPDQQRHLAIALLSAVVSPHENITNLLLDRGADLMYVVGESSERHLHAWHRLFTATESIPLTLINAILLHNPEITEDTFVYATMRGNIDLLQAVFRHAVQYQTLTYEMWLAAVEVSVQHGYHNIVEWLFDEFANKFDREEDILAEVPAFIKLACKFGFNEVVRILIKFSRFFYPSVVELCTLRGHLGALKEILKGQLIMELPKAANTFRVHATASRREYKAAAKIFAIYAANFIDPLEIVEFLATSNTDDVECWDVSCGRLPALLIPLLYDQNLQERAQAVLKAADNKLLHLFGFCSISHPPMRKVALCRSCALVLHFKCAECATIIPLEDSERQHDWEVVDFDTNSMMHEFLIKQGIFDRDIQQTISEH